MMNPTFEELVKRSKVLDTHLRKLSKANAELSDKATTVLLLLAELGGSATQTIDTCPVCCSRPREFALLPCGHLFCESCSGRAQTRGRCYTCRTPIENVARIYI